MNIDICSRLNCSVGAADAESPCSCDSRRRLLSLRAARESAEIGSPPGVDNGRVKGREERDMKYVLVTGGVVSGLGKGVTASSIGVVLKACGLRVTSIKIGISLSLFLSIAN